ncbi:MAG TPA: ABC transporter permease subunit [Candidatus Binatia bacterium]|nr:ABC transporter permease subunit [Candidatus Binatia bacterium]
MAVSALGRRLGLRRAVATPSPDLGTPAVGVGQMADVGRPPGGGWRSHLGSLAFLAPAAIWLLVIVAYPLIGTIRNSFYDNSSTQFVGLGNYKTIFSTADILVSFRNNVIWVVVFPFLVTFLGLVFAVLTERVRWATAFKTIIFMPIAFSATASALVWNSIMDVDPHVGMVNATLQTINDWFSPPGLYPVNTGAGQTLSELASTGLGAGANGTLVSKAPVSPGQSVQLGMLGISPATLQLVGAQKAVIPASASGAVTGLVWRDFSPTNPTARGRVFADEDGIAGLRVTLLSSSGNSVGSTTTDAHGDFTFSGVSPGAYRVQLDSSNFSSGFTGIYWLSGTQNIDPTSGLNQTAQALLSIPLVDLSMIIAYLWIWAGFAMVIIGAGLAALNREVLEAARIDGANEWQTFRRVTMPMLAPVLVVVFVTMVINVLKIFDIILNMAPSVSQANTLATSLYNLGFASSPPANGLASAIAVILFVLVVPVIYINLRRIR